MATTENWPSKLEGRDSVANFDAVSAPSLGHIKGSKYRLPHFMGQCGTTEAKESPKAD